LRCKIVKTKEFPAKIVQDKELRGVSASGNLFGLKNGAKRTCRDNDLQEEFLGPVDVYLERMTAAAI